MALSLAVSGIFRGILSSRMCRTSRMARKRERVIKDTRRAGNLYCIVWLTRSATLLVGETPFVLVGEARQRFTDINPY